MLIRPLVNCKRSFVVYRFIWEFVADMIWSGIVNHKKCEKVLTLTCTLQNNLIYKCFWRKIMIFVMAKTYNMFRYATPDDSLYSNLYTQSVGLFRDTYTVVEKVGFYSLAIAVVWLAVVLMVMKGNPQDLAAGKQRFIRVSVVAILFFGVVGIWMYRTRCCVICRRG